MQESSETERLAEAMNALAATMTEMMTERMRAIAEDQERRIASKMVDPLLDKRGVAERMGCTVRSVDTWMQRGFIPY